MNSSYKLILSCLLFLLTTSLYAQQSKDVSVSLLVYPTGIIPQLSIDKIISKKSSLGIKVGANIFRHRDLGVHDDERGHGFGLTPTYTYYFNSLHTKWHISLKNDIWWNHVDWSDELNNSTVGGQTDIIVLQPTAEIGHSFLFGQSFILTPSLAAGLEWNIKTDGEPTGQGPIVLIGIKLGKRF